MGVDLWITLEPVAELPEITVDALLDRYAVLLLDAYGVLVTSAGAVPGAAAFIARLNRAGKPYYVVTNDASRLAATSARRYQGFGLALDEPRFITSGQLLGPFFAREGLTGAACVVLGTADSVAYVERAGGRLVAADAPFDAGREVHLVCANPDLIYPSGIGFGIASDSVALVLEAALFGLDAVLVGTRISAAAGSVPAEVRPTYRLRAL